MWKAIYFHYLPIGVEADAPPTRAQLGKAAVTWAAVSLADKLDTIVGLFAAGEKPTGSRDPYGLRRAAQGVIEDPDGLCQPVSERRDGGWSSADDRRKPPTISARRGSSDDWQRPLSDFLAERLTHLLDRRGFRADEARAVVPLWGSRPGERAASRAGARPGPKIAGLRVARGRSSSGSRTSRKGFDDPLTDDVRSILKEPAEIALLDGNGSQVADD